MLNAILLKPPPPILLSACRLSIGFDPILFLPMTIYGRSRILRWRMGWLPARPVVCNRCGAPHASRDHLVVCLSVAQRLNVSFLARHPLDYFLNTFLPIKKPTASSSASLTTLEKHFVTYWPIFCTIMMEIDVICHPDEEFPAEAANPTGDRLLQWFKDRPNPDGINA